MTIEENLKQVHWNIEYYQRQIEKAQLEIECYRNMEAQLLKDLDGSTSDCICKRAIPNWDGKMHGRLCKYYAKPGEVAG
ncbi:MAG: hypothetical protein WB870_06665 [Gallionellaceae bacterium]